MSTAKICINSLSELPQTDFVACLDGIFEHSPWIAERTWNSRPFADLNALHSTMLAVLDKASETEKLALICAHPELAGKEADEGTLTAASTSEQRGAGLDQCSKEELLRLRALNVTYRERFGFPFVVAVKGMSRYQIMERIDTRLLSDRDAELNTCLHEIGKIARFRLDALLT